MKNIPQGYVAVEVIIKPDGTYEAETIGHGPDTSCLETDDDKILDDVLMGIGEAIDSKRTDQYYEEKQKRMSKSKSSKFEEEDEPKKTKGIDLGFGV